MIGQQLRFYNSLGRRIEDFTPSAAETRVYSCGPTVHAFPHLGSMRPYVFADTLRRALRWKDIPVRHITNITDVRHAIADSDASEDRLEVVSAPERGSVDDLAAFYSQTFFDDISALNVLPADQYPRASAYVEQMIEFATRLEEGGFTYVLPSGLYFDMSKSPDCGTRMHLAGWQETAHVEQAEGRQHKADFALWRAEEPGRRRVMRWNSPWGWGAPGWHLECSVMSMALLGEHFDIHTGCSDLRELHHVNEIAQSQAYLGDGKPWVRYWLHNEFLHFDEQKIAKSPSSAPRLADLMEVGYHPAAYRLFLLGGHYRSQLDFTTIAMDAAQATLRRLVRRIDLLRPLPAADTLRSAWALLPAAGLEGDIARVSDKASLAYLKQLDAAISADLATPKVLATLQDSLRDPEISGAGQRIIVAAADALLGLGLADLDACAVECHQLGR